MNTENKTNPQTKISPLELFIAEVDEKFCAMQARQKFLNYLNELEQRGERGENALTK